MLLIVAEIKLRDDKATHTTSLRKVPAHVGVVGNEQADSLAKAVVDNKVPIDAHTHIHREGAAPQRPTYWIFKKAPPSPSDPTPAAPQLIALTDLKKSIPKIARPLLGTATAKPSLYHTLMQHTTQNEGALLRLPASIIAAKRAAGHTGVARRLFKFLWGVLYNDKLAHRYGHALNDHCPLCDLPDSCTHIGGGCKKLAGLYIDRHNAACRKVATAITQSTKGASALIQHCRLVSCDAGTKPLPDSDDFDTLTKAHEEILSLWDQIDLTDIVSATDTRAHDVTFDIASIQAAASRS